MTLLVREALAGFADLRLVLSTRVRDLLSRGKKPSSGFLAYSGSKCGECESHFGK
jgi:hypothetical protein